MHRRWSPGLTLHRPLLMSERFMRDHMSSPRPLLSCALLCYCLLRGLCCALLYSRHLGTYPIRKITSPFEGLSALLDVTSGYNPIDLHPH
jgi:hypothetical protein